MALKTEETLKAALPVDEFYDGLAPDYDLMTGFEKRFIKDRPFFHVLVEKNKIRSALDAGCGTGFHSILLAQLGVDVTAVDVSGEMVKKAAEHAREAGVQIKTFRETFENLPDLLDEKYDLVLSLGNTLAHILEEKQMLNVLEIFRSLLNDGGHLFLQLLNYEKILRERPRIQNMKDAEHKSFVRSYEYGEREIAFTILTRSKLADSPAEEIRSVSLYPWRYDEIAGLVRQAGFGVVEPYGGIALQEFRAETSKDLVIMAKSS